MLCGAAVKVGRFREHWSSHADKTQRAMRMGALPGRRFLRPPASERSQVFQQHRGTRAPPNALACSAASNQRSLYSSFDGWQALSGQGVRDMSYRVMCALLFGVILAVGAFGSPSKDHHDPSAAHSKVDRHDPAFRTGYMDGYRQGSNDSEAFSNSYNDESGPVYDEALDGYTPQYGDQATYQKLFRLGYIAGYKDGWDFKAGWKRVPGA